MHKAQIPLLLVRDRHNQACVEHNSDIRPLSTSQTRDACERPQPGPCTPAPCTAMAPGLGAQQLRLHAALMRGRGLRETGSLSCNSASASAALPYPALMCCCWSLASEPWPSC